MLVIHLSGDIFLLRAVPSFFFTTPLTFQMVHYFGISHGAPILCLAYNHRQCELSVEDQRYYTKPPKPLPNREPLLFIIDGHHNRTTQQPCYWLRSNVSLHQKWWYLIETRTLDSIYFGFFKVTFLVIARIGGNSIYLSGLKRFAPSFCLQRSFLTHALCWVS